MSVLGFFGFAKSRIVRHRVSNYCAWRFGEDGELKGGPAGVDRRRDPRCL
jgi:hypothetical protein